MYPTITVVQHGGAALYLTIVDPITVGRECDGLLLADEKVSRQHLVLSAAGESVKVTDLESTNGCFIDGVRVVGDGLLESGSTLQLGDTTIRVEPPPPPRPVAQTTARDVGGTVVATLDPAMRRPAGNDHNADHPTPEPVAEQSKGTPSGSPPTPSMVETRRTSIEELAESFGRQPVSVPGDLADNTVTIMFSDIESSTEIALSIGDERWYEVLSRHNQLVEKRVAAHGGKIVKNQGDGFMVTFNSARRAIICAAEIQQALHREAVANPQNSVRVRIGMHTGEAIRQDSGDLFGRHVIIAARVGSSAAGGEVLVSSIVHQIASARGDLYFGEGRSVELKGVGYETVFPVLWGAELPAS